MTSPQTTVATLATSTTVDDYVVGDRSLHIADRTGATYEVDTFSIRTTRSGGRVVATLITWSGYRYDGVRAYGQTLSATYPGDGPAFALLTAIAQAAS